MVDTRWLRKVGALGALMALLPIVTAAPASPAAPLGAGIGLSPRPAWAGHPACRAPVDVTLSGDVVDVGGYETRLSFNTAFAGYTSGNVTPSDWLNNGGTRRSGGDDGSTILQKPGAGSVKFGDYSWGTADGADATASAPPPKLATVGIDIVKCGSSSLSLSETQLVDVKGNVLPVSSQATNVPMAIHHMMNTNGDAIPVVTGQDVLAVANALNSSAACTANYQFNANSDNIPVVTGQDVLAVANALNSSVSCP